LSDKPTAAFVLSLLGGIFVLIGGLVQTFLGAFISSIGMATGASNATGVGSTFGILGMVSGVLMIMGGVLMYARPQTHTMWSAIVLVLSLVSLATSTVGGFFIGFILGLIGAILGLKFKPTMTPGALPGQSMRPMSMGSPSMGSMSNFGASSPAGSGAIGTSCRSCGGSIPAGASRCPNCGASI
jgi:Family of unknown function (DUF6114)